ncbi:Hypothetical predicted protein, partial [Xyrichtys novacula]
TGFEPIGPLHTKGGPPTIILWAFLPQPVLKVFPDRGPVIKAAAASDATPASTSHPDPDRSRLSISGGEAEGF